jgi:hypothetical protein
LARENKTMRAEPVLSRFSYDAYLDMLRRFRDAGYVFAPFTDAQRLLADNRRFVLLRHDVDMDLEKAREMAQREADAGVSATYFFLVRTDHYNVFSRFGTESVREILAPGHRLGLHFDCATYPHADVAGLRAGCAREVAMLERWFDARVTVVSYHRPNETVLSGDPALSAPLPHTYMPLFRRNVKYLSDSTGRWRYEYPPDSRAFKMGLPIQLLTHPVWYAATPQRPCQALVDVLSAKAEFLERSFADNCTVMRQRATKSDRPGSEEPTLASGPLSKDAA